jgi:superfamily II DNA/RNA helicase
MDGSLKFSALKEKQRAIRAGFPETMGLRVHRAISWVGRSEACDGDDDARFAEFLKQQGLAAEHFHAGLKPDEKRDIQERFRIGELRVIAATNAFGMGIDKPDIRLVVHGDIPGSLENYLQEAGRAGRDREHANCVLLFAGDDVERQFSLSARSRLARHEIGAILKALRRLDGRTSKHGEVVATSGEIVRAEKDLEFERDTATDDMPSRKRPDVRLRMSGSNCAAPMPPRSSMIWNAGSPCNSPRYQANPHWPPPSVTR